jgi:hypothetical protein
MSSQSEKTGVQGAKATPGFGVSPNNLSGGRVGPINPGEVAPHAAKRYAVANSTSTRQSSHIDSGIRPQRIA